MLKVTQQVLFFRRFMKALFNLSLIACISAGYLNAQIAPVALSEVMYHPVEKPAFQADGTPQIDLSEDVHEFVELFNTTSNAVDLSGWSLSGGISYTFPLGAVIPSRSFVVIAKNPQRLAAIPSYGLNGITLFGPYSGVLANGGDTLRLNDNQNAVVDAMSYSSSSPWPISANALGAKDDFTGLSSSNYQYRGRSLERVSYAWPANDPANWIASSLSGGPSPGRTNSLQLLTPRPVISSISVLQQSDKQPLIRANQAVQIECTLTATNGISNPSIEYFVDNVDSTGEPHFSAVANVIGSPSEGRFIAALPGQADRSVVRYRFRANRGSGVEAVSPREDDPFQWHAYFVTPARTSSNPIYDLFVSQADLTTMSTNITQSPRRVSQPDPPGYPRESWNATVPAIFIYNGVVRDIRIRHHGSRYSRTPGRFSMKWQFPDYNLFEGREGIFETDKRDYFIAGHGLFEAAGLPTSRLRHADVYINNDPVRDRLEQEENDDFMLERFHKEQEAANPGSMREGVGEIYKCEGILPPATDPSDGPYGVGNFSLLPAISTNWTPLQRYEYTWALQDHGWKGAKPFKDMIEGFWAARGDTPSSPNLNIPAVRAWLEQNFDMDATLTYMAIRQWGAAYDHITQNYFLWRRANGKWALLPWDFDDEYYVPFVTWSIYQGEVGDTNPTERGPNYLYDAIYKAFRQEYKQRLFVLNHTLLNPTNITALGYGSILSSDQGSTMRGWADQRFALVNQKLGLGQYLSPLRPSNLAPANGSPALPPNVLQASAYAYTAAPAVPHASTTWMIRHANGTYLTPILRLTTTTNLTSLPIPFENLTFGETYFWKCSYNDTNGHPSLESAETSFVFGSAPTVISLIPIDGATFWKYDMTGSSTPNWNQPNFNDSSWQVGLPLLAQETCGCLPEPIRTTLSVGSKVTAYFRKQFVFPGPTAGVELRIRQIVDDGAVVYLNGVEVSRTRMPSGIITSNTLANTNVGDAVYEGPNVIPSGSLISGTNVLAVEVHQLAAGGSDLTFGLALEALMPNNATGAILLNEILADNRGAVTNVDGTPDYIELYNSTDLPRDVGGMSLSDDVTNPGRFVFPTNTIIPAHGYLLVWCDNDVGTPGLHTGFGLESSGQTVALFNAAPAGWQLGDFVTFGLQVPDFSIGRVGSAWRLNSPTPGVTNVEMLAASPAGLRINEWMASSSGSDWFELFNTNSLPVALGGLFLSDDGANVTNTRIPALSFIAPRGYSQFIADEDEEQGAQHVDFKLSANGDTILLSDTNRALIDQVSFTAQGFNISQGRLLDGSSNIVSFPGSGSPEAANYLTLPGLVVSEVLSHTVLPLQDEIEIQNITSIPINIGNWWLSDDVQALKKFRIPTNTIVAPGGFVVFHQDQFDSTNAAIPFGLNGSHGDEVLLSAANGSGELTGARISTKFDAAENGVSHGRISTSVGIDFGALAARSFGASNSLPLVGPVVISEIQYHPPSLPGDDDDYEFIELQNISGAPVALFDTAFPTNCWRLRDAVRFIFPTNTTLAPGQRVLVVGFDPVTNLSALANFRLAYGLSTNAALFGPYRGKLDNSGATVELVKPDAPISIVGPDFGYVPSILIDRVKYSDAAPWPVDADGFGPSLQRLNLSGYGNEPTNWFANGLTPAAANGTNGIASVSIISPGSNAVFSAGSNITIAVNAVDVDGTVQRVEFYANGTKLGEATNSPFTFIWSGAAQGSHVLMARAFDSALTSANSAPVPIRVTNVAPSVVIVSPTNGATFSVPVNVLIETAATDLDGVIEKVEFYSDGIKLGESAGAPFNFTWFNAAPGAHVLSARAIDSASASNNSTPVSIVISNQAPSVAITSPGNGASFSAPTNILIQASASDPDGIVQKVEFYADGIKLGEDASAPFQFVWIDAGSGAHALSARVFDAYSLSRTSVTVTINVVGSSSYTAYIVQPGTIGGQDYGGGIGMDFNVNQPIVISRLGVFDSRGDGLSQTLTTQIFNRDTAGMLASLTFNSTSQGTLESGTSSRFKALAQPLILPPGNYSVVSWGYNAVDRNGNSGIPEPKTWSTDSGGGLITFVGVCRNGSGGVPVGTFPTNPDGGPADRYAAGTFQYSPLLPPVIIQHPTNTQVLPGMSIAMSVTASGTAPLSYRWRRNGTTLPTQTNATLFFSNPQPSDSGAYTAVVTNYAGSVTSLVATLTVTADSDGDGMPDAWEDTYGLDYSVFDPDLDSDADGATNLQEYLSGTNPRDAASYLRLRIGSTLPLELEFLATSNKTYSVLSRLSIDAFGWNKMTNVGAAPTNRIVRVVDPSATNSSRRFYRLTTPQLP